ncbi:hypothetical protein FRZ03_09600 [Streptomyces misionensis]|uniref:Peptidase inhibitor family I36 n=1 Tax=Streptomyces misionensis TaxID=67331 RepID=A0A5C6JXZ2_9ACTN|nr:hypothetical protein [Streptomyces misionensis]TWV53591.1 hypothetical protein FRZ03_09600 [Streptomyces misionensis]
MRAAAAVAGVAAAFALATTPASAVTGVNVGTSARGGWNDHCNYTGAYGCLYYSPNGAGGIFEGYGYYADLSGYTFSDGHSVRNNAASIGNATTNCNSTTWVSPHSGGDYNWVSSGRGGNLTSSNPVLRNNEASFDATASCT